jgi:hemolysin activation/secretion protein
MRRLFPAGWAAALFAFALTAGAQKEAPLTLRFDIAVYRVEGNSLLKQSAIDRLLAPYRGKQRDFGDVQRALEALQQAYRDAGYGAVQVYLPEQELDQGVVTLRVIEAKLGKVSVQGNRHFGEKNIRRSLPDLREDTTPSAPRIADDTQLANENPSKKVRVVLRPGRPNEADATIEVQDEKPWRAFLTADNTGTEETGRTRLGVGLQHNNVFNRDHSATVQYVTSPEEPDQVSIYSLGWRAPLYGLGDSIDVFGGYSDVDAGVTQTPAGPLAFTGVGYVAGARYNWLLPRRGEYEHRFIFGADYRLYENDCTLSNTLNCGSDLAVHPLSVAYVGTRTGARSQLSFNLAALQNIAGGSKGSEEDLQTARSGAEGNYFVLRGGLSAALVLWRDFQARVRLDGQYTDDQLIPGEQFGVGGWYSVRGFLEREIADDRGYSGSLELYSPDIAQAVKIKWANLRLLAFYDFGSVERNDPAPGDPTRQSVASAGGGLRLSLAKNFSLRADVATVLNAGGAQGDGDVRAHVGLVASY